MNLDTFKLKKNGMNLLHCRINVDGAIKTVFMYYKLFFETEQTHQPPSLSALPSAIDSEPIEPLFVLHSKSKFEW